MCAAPAAAALPLDAPREEVEVAFSEPRRWGMSFPMPKVTRTGKAVLSPDSSLYLINPCPPARVLPKHHDFVDEHGNKYYNSKTAKLQEWAQSESMQAKIGAWKEEGDMLFFVKQSKEARGRAGFVLPVEGTLELFAADTGATVLTAIVAVGDAAAQNYKARAVRWMLVRGMLHG
jgi:hypothetical protein